VGGSIGVLLAGSIANITSNSFGFSDAAGLQISRLPVTGIQGNEAVLF